MENVAFLNSSTRAHPTEGNRVRLYFAIAGFVFLWFILCRHLSNEWSANEQYSYGWFVPFFAAYLFWLRWETRSHSRPEVRSQMPDVSSSSPISNLRPPTPGFLLPTLAFLLFFLLLPVRLFEVGNPDWRPLGWVHATIVVALTFLLIWRIGGVAWLKHFAFPVAFIFIAVPWVSPIEEPIVQGLMRIVAAIACETVNLLGIPAQLEGSVIRISSGVVGVNEACSGVRSLQTSLMIGLLFGELKRLSLVRRFLLLAGAIGIAFLANCGRAFFLVWIAATRNIDAVAQWHDLAGYAILVAVFLGTVGLATILSKQGKSPNAKVENETSDVRPPTADFRPHTSRLLLSTSYFLLPLLWLLAVECGVEAWYRSHEQNLVATSTWSVHWPEQSPGFREIKIDENVKATLRYDAGRQATWPLTQTKNEQPITDNTRASASMFFFRWEPGATSILRARSHRPDICLPNTGWRVTDDRGVRKYPAANGTEMSFRHFAFARPAAENRTATAHAFFCQREDRVPSAEAARFDLNAGATSDWSRSDRLRVVLEGLRNQGQQVLEVVILSPRPVDSLLAEGEFAKLVPQIVTTP